jgi:hypothetical protein
MNTIGRIIFLILIGIMILNPKNVRASDQCDLSLGGTITFTYLNSLIYDFQQGKLPDLDQDSRATICFHPGSMIETTSSSDVITTENANADLYMRIQLRGSPSDPVRMIDTFPNLYPHIPTALISTGLPDYSVVVGGLAIENMIIESGKNNMNAIYMANQDLTLKNVDFRLSGHQVAGVRVTDFFNLAFEMHDCRGTFSGNDPRIIDVRGGSGGFSFGGGVYDLKRNSFLIQDGSESNTASLTNAISFSNVLFVYSDGLSIFAPDVAMPIAINLDNVRFGDLLKTQIVSPGTELGIYLNGAAYFGKITGTGSRLTKVKKPMMIQSSQVEAIANWKMETESGIEFSLGSQDLLVIQLIAHTKIKLITPQSQFGLIMENSVGGVVQMIKRVEIEHLVSNSLCISDPQNWIQTVVSFNCL